MNIWLIVILVFAFLFWLDRYIQTDFSKQNKLEYMTSDKWKSLRLKILKRDNYKCQGCGSEDKLEVHHITYKRLGKEKLKDLVVVCRSCHQKIHSKYGYSYENEYPLDI